MGDWGQRDGGPIDRHLRVINKEARVGDRRCLVGGWGQVPGASPWELYPTLQVGPTDCHMQKQRKGDTSVL